MLDLAVELLGQLTVDRLDDLADGVAGATDGLRRLVGLVGARQGAEVEAIVGQQLAGQCRPDKAPVAKDGQIGMRW